MKIDDLAKTVQHAEEAPELDTGTKKQAHVKTVLAAKWPKIKNFLVNALIELAIIWAVNKGLIRK